MENKNTIHLKDIKGVLVIIQLEDGAHQVITTRKAEAIALNIITQHSPGMSLNVVEEPLEGLSIEYAEGQQSFEDYFKESRKWDGVK
jgi:hypothetical protein